MDSLSPSSQYDPIFTRRSRWKCLWSTPLFTHRFVEKFKWRLKQCTVTISVYYCLFLDTSKKSYKMQMSFFQWKNTLIYFTIKRCILKEKKNHSLSRFKLISYLRMHILWQLNIYLKISISFWVYYIILLSLVWSHTFGRQCT